MNTHTHRHLNAQAWQPQTVLAVTAVPVAAWLAASAPRSRLLLQAAAIAVALALAVYLARAATPCAAAIGGLFTAALYCYRPGAHTLLWPLLTMLALALAATGLGRPIKQRLGTAESRRGRNAAQVAANIGVAALPFSMLPGHGRAGIAMSVAALAEAAADTVSSEVGQVFGGEPRLLTTLRRVPRGTDGGVTLGGTAAGLLAALAVAAAAALALRLTLAVFAAGAAGLFADSLLGATLERRGWLVNDAVNFLSTAIAAALAALLCRWL